MESAYSADSTPLTRSSAARVTRSSSSASATLFSVANSANSGRYRSKDAGSIPSGSATPANSSVLPNWELSSASSKVSRSVSSSRVAA